MPLNEGAINEILQFAAEALQDAGDVLSLEDYKNHPMRLRGHMVGLALRELQNIEARQATHMASGLAQFIANRYTPGVLDDGDLDKVEEGLLYAITEIAKAVVPEIPEYEKYDLCEFYYFRHPALKPGFQPAQGGLLANARTLYPDAWKYLTEGAGQVLCKTEAEWQALTRAIWATLADGTQIGWNGIGGAPFYAPNTATGALRLPDLRGMYMEAAGYDSLDVGGVHGDGIRNFSGRFDGANLNASGVFTETLVEKYYGAGGALRSWIDFNPSRVTPTANKVQPRAWGALPCVYLGPKAS